LRNFSNIKDGAVVFGFFITVAAVAVMGRCMMDRCMVHRCVMHRCVVHKVMSTMIGERGDKREEDQDSEYLHV